MMKKIIVIGCPEVLELLEKYADKRHFNGEGV